MPSSGHVPTPSPRYATVAQSPYPAAVLLDLTDGCNLRCRMCGYWGPGGLYRRKGSARSTPATLDLDVALRLVAELAPGRPTYALFGGEPLLYPHLQPLITAMKRAGSVVTMVTNGVALAPQAELLVATGLDAIRVSIDGPATINDAQRGRGSFRKALDGMAAIRAERARQQRRGPSLGVAYAITPENFAAIEALFLPEHRGALGLRDLDFVGFNAYLFMTAATGAAYQAMLDDEWGVHGREHWRAYVRDPGLFDAIDCVELARQIRTVRLRLQRQNPRAVVETMPRTPTAANLRAYFTSDVTAMSDGFRYCFAPWLSVHITSMGGVLPCMGATDFELGSLHDGPFLAQWHGARFEKLRTRIWERGLMPQCHACCMLYRLGSWRRPLL